jgi:hypothetical protein
MIGAMSLVKVGGSADLGGFSAGAEQTIWLLPANITPTRKDDCHEAVMADPK